MGDTRETGRDGVQTNKGRPPFYLVLVRPIVGSFEYHHLKQKPPAPIPIPIPIPPPSHFLLHEQIANSVNTGYWPTISVYSPSSVSCTRRTEAGANF